MTEEEIIQTINDNMINEFELSPGAMVPRAHLVDDLGMDSLDFVDLVVVLQEAFSVKFRDDPRVKELLTLEDLHQLVIVKKAEMDN